MIDFIKLKKCGWIKPQFLLVFFVYFGGLEMRLRKFDLNSERGFGGAMNEWKQIKLNRISIQDWIDWLLICR